MQIAVLSMAVIGHKKQNVLEICKIIKKTDKKLKFTYLQISLKVVLYLMYASTLVYALCTTLRTRLYNF